MHGADLDEVSEYAKKRQREEVGTLGSGNPELAIGSVDETGRVYLSEHVRELGINDDYLEKEKQAQLKMLHKRRAQCTPVRPPLDLSGRIVIVVDNGIVTGASMIAALRAVRAKHPRKAYRSRGGCPTRRR